MFSKKISLLSQTNNCAFCTQPANSSCERCGELYCSLMCQMNDWRNHRHICIPLPRLVPLTRPSNRMRSNCQTSSIGEVEGVDATDTALIDAGRSETSIIQCESVTSSSHDNGVDITKVIAPAMKKCQITDVVPKEEEKTLQAVPEAAVLQTKTPAKKQPQQQQLPIVPSKQPPIEPMYEPCTIAMSSNTEVFITHVHDHCTVFVHPNEKKAAWEKLTKEVCENSANAQHLLQKPKIDYVIAAPSVINEMYGRAIIKQIRNNLVEVEFLEFGHTEKVKLSQLKCLSIDLVNRPRLVNKLTLMDVPQQHNDSDEIIDYLADRQQGKIELMLKNVVTIDQTAFQVNIGGELIEMVTFQSINRKIVKWNEKKAASTAIQAVALNDAKDDQIAGNEKAVQKEFPYVGFSGKNIEVLVLDNSMLKFGYVSAVRVIDGSLLGENDTKINENAKQFENGKPFRPLDHEMCIAKSGEDQRWYRASSYGKFDDETYMVMFIDYGNMEKVPVGRIREITDEFSFPCVTVSCYLDGIGNVNSEERLPKPLVARLEKMLPAYGKIVFDEVLYNEDEGLAQCKSQNFIETLKKEQLI